MPTLAIVANTIGDSTSIGSIAGWDAREALRRGWDVLAVCEHLDPVLAGDGVDHRPLYVPPRLHAVQYAAGRATVRRALRRSLRRRGRPVVVTHQPQSAAIADVWNVHYLERAARAVRGPARPGWKGRAADASGGVVAGLEDRFVRALPPTTRVLFCSRPLAEEFARRYGAPPSHAVVPNPAPGPPDPIEAPDRARRTALVGGHRGPVVGFLGGDDPRKGGDLLQAAVAREPELLALVAGHGAASAGPRVVGLGHLDDVRDLLDVVDALVVPSRFEPFGLVVVEAAARGVPVILTPAVGSAPLVVEHGAGLLWDGRAPLLPLVRRAIEDRPRLRAGGVALARALDRDAVADLRFAEFEAAAARR